MLPQGRISEDIFAIPKYGVKKQDVDGFMEKLRGFHAQFADCFNRSEPRRLFFQYMVGQFSDLQRKSAEPIAMGVEGAKVRGIQRLLSDVRWDEAKMKDRYHGLVREDLGHESGVLIFDESAFPKKGSDSVGVARQYCGTLGKVENCQVGVFAAYASPQGYSLLDKKLFLPEKWFSAEYAQRRKKCNIPKELEFKTKPQLAAEMFEEIKKAAIIPFKYVLADTLYGDNPTFIDSIEASPGTVCFLAVSCNTLCFLKAPDVVEKSYKYKGKEQVRQVVSSGDTQVRVDVLAQNINDYFWYRRKVSEGTKGPIEYEFAKKEVVLSRKGLPEKTVWLIVKRTLGENPSCSYYISNAPKNTRLKTFVWLSGVRWPIEQCFEETKGELGMDHYEVRKYAGWNHHILSCMLAHFFLWHLRITLGEKIPGDNAAAA